MQTLSLVANESDFIQSVSAKIARFLANKEAKKDSKADLTFLIKNYTRQISNGIKTTQHFVERVRQRFEEQEANELYIAISRAIRGTRAVERGSYGDHLATTQKFIDESGIAVVLEKQGAFGAVLVTTYKVGSENLLSDEELADLKKRGVL